MGGIMLTVQNGERDECTGLPNYKFFQRNMRWHIKNIKNAEKKPAMVFFDIRQFHLYNLYYGYEAGDEFLEKVGRVIRKNCQGDIYCHTTEDHYVVLTDQDDLEEKILTIASDVKRINDGNGMVIQAGIYQFEDGMYECTGAMDKARIACDSIATCFNTVFEYFDPSKLEENDRATCVIHQIDRAIQQEIIEVYYQPIFDTQTEELCAFEALSRWHDPSLGFLSPGEYIPVLEKFNLIEKHDLYMLKRVCRDIKAYQKAAVFYGVPVTINLSRRDFANKHLAQHLIDLIDSYGVDHRLICFEITESTMADDTHMEKQVIRLWKEGFHIWMDDFGSDYSSLSYLAQYDFAVVKADMRFLYNFEKCANNKVILKHVCNMCRDLGIVSLAEGVETREQVEFLKQIRCDRMQGYYMSKPKPLSVLEEEFRKGQFVVRSAIEK